MNNIKVSINHQILNIKHLTQIINHQPLDTTAVVEGCGDVNVEANEDEDEGGEDVGLWDGWGPGDHLSPPGTPAPTPASPSPLFPSSALSPRSHPPSCPPGNVDEL